MLTYNKQFVKFYTITILDVSMLTYNKQFVKKFYTFTNNLQKAVCEVSHNHNLSCNNVIYNKRFV